MMTIYKYQFETNDYFSLDLPAGATVLSVQVQHGIPCMWAMVTPGAPMQTQHFRVFGTGHPIREEDNAGLDFIGTYQMNGGEFVFHLFEDNGG